MKILQSIDIITPNEIETAVLTGITPDSTNTAQKAAEQLQAVGCPTVIITAGSDGCFLVNDGVFKQISANEVKAGAQRVSAESTAEFQTVGRENWRSRW